MWLCTKRALNATDWYRERFEDSRARIAEDGKAIQDAHRLFEENAAKIAELSAEWYVSQLRWCSNERELRLVCGVLLGCRLQTRVGRVLRHDCSRILEFAGFDMS